MAFPDTHSAMSVLARNISNLSALWLYQHDWKASNDNEWWGVIPCSIPPMLKFCLQEDLELDRWRAPLSKPPCISFWLFPIPKELEVTSPTERQEIIVCFLWLMTEMPIPASSSSSAQKPDKMKHIISLAAAHCFISVSFRLIHPS